MSPSGGKNKFDGLQFNNLDKYFSAISKKVGDDMKKTENIKGKDIDFELPNICPNCGTGMRPTYSTCTVFEETPEIGITFLCPECRKLSFVVFTIMVQKPSVWVADLSPEDKIFSKRVALYPTKYIKPQIPDDMKKYFPDFYEIYAQANIAENRNLHQITGMAYRKALEYLVKQYLIEKKPDEKSKILVETLGQSISRLDYPIIKNLARAASWIGNDETHIIRKYPDKDINDMKRFINSLCHLILAEKVAEEAEQMTSKRN